MIDWDSLVIAPLMAAFGQPVLYQPVGGTAFTINGVYDEAYRDVQAISDSAEISTTMPVVGVRVADFPSPPKRGDKLVIVATSDQFIVKDVRPDGHGEAKLMLNFVRKT